MTEGRYRMLFVCTGNSARSIMAEFLMNARSGGRFVAFSAGASPRPSPHPMALAVLRDKFLIDASAARSKPLSEFDGQTFDFVITLCDKAQEQCPTWPGHPIFAHWQSPDPAAFRGDRHEAELLFARVGWQISQRIGFFLSLPLDKIESQRQAFAEKVRAIGERAQLDQ